RALPVEHLRDRHLLLPPTLLEVDGPDHDQPVRLPVGQRLQEESVHEGEDRDRESDAERQCRGGRGARRPVAEKGSPREAQVLPGALDGASPDPTALLPRQVQAAELEPRGPARLVVSAPRGPLLALQHLEMDPDLFVELAVERRAAPAEAYLP